MELAAVVLAGGMGTRLRSVVADRPKVLAPLRAGHFLRTCSIRSPTLAFERVVLSTGHLAEQFADGDWRSISEHPDRIRARGAAAGHGRGYSLRLWFHGRGPAACHER